ncbi:MAG TPA: hypothetical protein PKC83_11110 [Gemmatimonadaceae bacterium]|nr:hypothetical protein [Gemmatimonadaceae bacterium]
MSTPPRYVYRVREAEVVDADTLRCVLDLGFDVRLRATVRVRGVYAPEIKTPEGQAAAARVREAISDATEVVVRTDKITPSQSFARYVADVWLDGVPLADLYHREWGLPRAGIGGA